MYTKPYPMLYKLLPFYLLFSVGLALVSCMPNQNQVEVEGIQVTQSPTLEELTVTPILPTSTTMVEATPTKDLSIVTPTTIPTVTAVITPTLINLAIPLETKNLPTYGWFSEDNQMVHFAYPKEGIIFSYDIRTQQLISSTLLYRSEEEIIEQITKELPSNARVIEVSPRYQNVLFTVPISQPTTLERGDFSVSLSDELWLYKKEGSVLLGAIDQCFQLHLTHDILWSDSEDLATVFAVSPMACAWSNWLIDIELLSVGPLNPLIENPILDEDAGLSDYYVNAILPNRELLVTPLQKDNPSAILNLQTQELTSLSNRGNEIAKYNDETILLSFSFLPSLDETENKTELFFSSLNEINQQLIGPVDGLIRKKYVSSDQKHILLFSGSSSYYGLIENQETSGVWLLSLP